MARLGQHLLDAVEPLTARVDRGRYLADEENAVTVAGRDKLCRGAATGGEVVRDDRRHRPAAVDAVEHDDGFAAQVGR